MNRRSIRFGFKRIIGGVQWFSSAGVSQREQYDRDLPSGLLRLAVSGCGHALRLLALTPSWWVKHSPWQSLGHGLVSSLALIFLLAHGTTFAAEFFVFEPIAARPAPKDFSNLGVPVSKELNTALRDYQTKPGMTTAIGVLKFFPEFYRMTVDQRQKLFDADPDLFLSVDIAKYELVMQTRIATGAKSSRRVGSTGQRELAIIQWRKGEGPNPGLDPAKQFTSDDDVTNLTDSRDLLADERVNGVKAEEAFRRVTREKYRNELNPKDIQTEFLSPTNAWAVFKGKYGSGVPPPPDYLYAWVASNPEKYNDPFGVYMLDVWGYDKGMYTGDVRDPLNTTKPFKEVYDRPTAPPAAGKFAYIADNYRQIYLVHHGRFESECKYLVRMIDAWGTVHGNAALPPDWKATRAMAEAVYKKGTGVEGANEFRGRIKGIIKNVVVKAHNYQLDRVIAELLPVFETLKNKPEGKLTRSDFEQYTKLMEELNGLLIAYTNVPDDVHKELMEQFRERIARAEASKKPTEILRSRVFMQIMEVVQDETGLQRGHIQAFERIRGSVTDKLGEAVGGADLAQFLENIAKGEAKTSRLRLQGLRVVREEVQLTPQDAMQQIEFIHALAEAFEWPNEKYALKVREYFKQGPDRAVQMLQRLSAVFDSTNAKPVTISYTDDSGTTVTETVVPSRTRMGLKLFAVSVRGGLQGMEWWGHAANGKELYQNLHKLFFESGSMTDLEIGQTQAALFANAINFNELVSPWKVPGASVLTANVVGSLSSSAGAVGYDDAANDDLLYAAFKDAAIMYQPQFAAVIAVIELGRWGYKDWALSGAKNDITDAMVENGIWEPADVKQLKHLKPGDLPALKGIRLFEGSAGVPVTTLAKIYAPITLIQSKRNVKARETLLDIAHDGGYLESDPVLQASVDALNEMSGTYFWRKVRLGVLPTNSRSWNKAEMGKLGINITRPEDDRAANLDSGQISVKGKELKLTQNQLRLMGYLMADYWIKRQVVLEDGLLPELAKAAARRHLDKLKEAEAEAKNYDFAGQLEEIYALVKKIDEKLWPRVARSATPFPATEPYDPDKHTPILDAFKADSNINLMVGRLQQIQDFLEDPNKLELKIEGHPDRPSFDRRAAAQEGTKTINFIRNRYYKLYDGYEQVHAILDEGQHLINEAKLKVEPFHIGFEPGAWALWALGEGLTPVRGDLATAKKWKNGYAQDERKRVYRDVAQKTKGAPPGSHLEILGQFIATVLNKDTVDTSGSPSHPLWPKLIRLRYQIHTLQLMQGYLDKMAVTEIQDMVTPMTIKEGESVSTSGGELYTLFGKREFLAKTIEKMEEEYNRLLASLTDLFEVTVQVEPAKPYIGQEIKASAKPNFPSKQGSGSVNSSTGFPNYVHKFRWTLEDLEGAAIGQSVATTAPTWSTTIKRAWPHYRVRVEALDAGGNPIAKTVYDGPRVEPLLVWGNIGIKSGDYDRGPFAVHAGGWRGEASQPGAFSIELKELDEALWKDPNTRVQADIAVDGKTYRSNRSEVEPLDPRTGLIKLKENLEFALPHNATINVEVKDRAGLAVPSAEVTVLVDGADKGKGTSVKAKLVTGSSVGANVKYEPLNLSFAAPAVTFDPAQGRAVNVKVELPMLDTGHLSVSGRFVPEAVLRPVPQLAGGNVTANVGNATVNQGAFSLTNKNPIDLRQGNARFEAQALVMDATGKRYQPKVAPIAGAIDKAKLDIGAIEVVRMLMTVKPIQVKLLDWTGKPIPAGAGATAVSINRVAAVKQGDVFSGEHSFADENESIIIEGAFTLPNGQQSVWQHTLKPADMGGWQQNPPPPPLLQLKLPFYLPGSLQVSGKTRVDGVPQGRNAPQSVKLRDDPHRIDANAGGNSNFGFVFPVPVQVTENISIQASAEDGNIKYAGAVATKAPKEGGSLNLGEIVLQRQGPIEIEVPDLAGFVLDGKANVGAMEAKVQSDGLAAGLPFASGVAPSEKRLEYQFARQSHAPRTKVPPGTAITVSIYQKFEDPQAASGLTPVSSTPDGSCPLTPDQARKAASAFSAMSAVLKHPRCINCHGVFADLHDNPNTRHPKPGGHIPQDAMGRVQDACITCHDRADASGTGEWRLPPPNMFFTRSELDICRGFKSTGGGTGADFISHITTDRLIQLGFEGKKGQSDKPAEPPPNSRENFLQLAKAWVAAVYNTTSPQEWKKSFPGTGGSACGCDASSTAQPSDTASPGPERAFKGIYQGTMRPAAASAGAVCEIELKIDETLDTIFTGKSGELNMLGKHRGDRCLGRWLLANGATKVEGGVLRWESQPSRYHPDNEKHIMSLKLNGSQLTGEYTIKTTHSNGKTTEERKVLEAIRTKTQW